MTNLDNLKKLLAAGAPGDWRQAGVDVKTHRHVIATADCWTHSALIVALHNAAPALIAELEAVRAENEKLRHDLVLEQLHHSIKNRLLDRQAPELKAARAVCEAALECKRINWFPSAELITALDAWQKARGE